MSSKFIKNSRVVNQPRTYEWTSMASPKEDKAEKEELEKYDRTLKSEKERIESIPLEELSFRDLYQFPFHQAKYGSWVYDANSNFIFQFEFDNKGTREKIIKILNGDVTEYNRQEVKSNDGYIEININGDWLNAILVRGWGNLTGVGAYNLDGKRAAKIQDTLQEYIVEKLSK